MEYTFEQSGRVGIFTFTGELTSKYEDNLKLLLMKAIHSIDKAVLNFKSVSNIDLKCLQLIRTAYCTSVRLKNPIILTEIPRNHLPQIFNCRFNKNFDHNYLGAKT